MTVVDQLQDTHYMVKVKTIAASNEVITLEKINCWYIIDEPIDEHILNSKFAIWRIWDAKGLMSSYKPQLLVCGNKENDFEDDRFSTITDFNVSKLILRLSIWKEWVNSHSDFESNFLNGRLERRIYER